MSTLPLLQLDSARIRGLMEAKNLREVRYYELGFKRGWLVKTQADNAPGGEAIRLAAWLEVPPEYLYGAAPEFDGLEAWEVASRASLDLLLRRDTDRRQFRELRGHLEQHLEAHRENAPRTIGQWKAIADAIRRGQAIERAETQSFERAAGTAEQTPPENLR